MADWSNLKSSLASVIKNNGNNEITGQALQDVLNSIISNLGANAQFAGVATPETTPGTPDGDVFYLAGKAAVYSNFSQITLENGEVAALIWNGSSWTKKTISHPYVNDLTTGGADKALSAEMGKELDGKLAELDSNVGEATKNITKDDEDDSLSIVDARGNVICRIDQEGIHTTGVTADEMVSNNGELFVIDENGYVALSISKDGTVRFNGKQKYTLYSLGDSLSTSGIWQDEVSKLLNVEFDNSLNVKSGSPLSVGGSTSFGEDRDIMPWRAKNLIDGGYIKGDGGDAIIVLENVNDIISEPTFDKSANAYNLDKVFECTSSQWGVSYLESIPSEERQINSAIRIGMTTSGKNLAITKLPTKEGDVVLRISTSATGNVDYGIRVNPSDSKMDIINKVLEYNYAKVTDSISDDGLSVDFSGAAISITFIDKDNTGMTVSITDTDNAKYTKMKYYSGTSLADWADASKWITGMTFSEGWKTTIEMLVNKYPKANIVVAMFPAHAVSADRYKKTNGLYDSTAYENTPRVTSMKKHREVLAEVADFYSIKFADVYSECGIGINNMLTYYNATANVHPKDEGYKCFGRTLASIIKSSINN